MVNQEEKEKMKIPRINATATIQDKNKSHETSVHKVCFTREDFS